MALFMSIPIFGMAQNSSVLATGEWHKLAIQNEGLYKLSGSDIAEMGVDINSLNPELIRIFGHTPGMQPQPNSASRVGDIQELSILVNDGGDGRFDVDDYLIFYGYGPDKFEFLDSLSSFSYEKHLFADLSYYFLNIGDVQGKRISAANQPVGSFPEISRYRYGFVHEENSYNRLHSGRLWLGETFSSTQPQRFETDITDVAENSDVELISSVVSTSNASSTFTISLNDTEIGVQQMSGVPNSTYALKGYHAIDTLKTVINGSSVPLTVSFQHQKSDSKPGYLDYFILNVERPMKYEGDPMKMAISSISGLQLTCLVENGTSINEVWLLNDPFTVERLQFNSDGGDIRFNLNNTGGSKVLAFDINSVEASPLVIGKLKNQNLRNTSNVELLIVTPEDFMDAANRLKILRESEGLSVLVTSANEIYNEFSGGKADITAIRDFARHLYQKAGLKHVLLFGKGVYDNKDISGSGLNILPIYQSRNSLNPLGTYGSDDYLSFLEEDEGEWAEQSGVVHTMDIGVGRIPVKSLQEANIVVDKLESYKRQSSLGTWRKEVMFIAEDGDLNIHQRDAERLSTLIDTTYSEFNSKKVYIDAYPIQINPGFKRAPEVNKEIENAINEGTFIVNYTGHGNERQWANTRVFDKRTIARLENINRYPLFVTATCEFGRHDDIVETSGAEDLIVKENAGAIAMITTSRPVFSSSNYTLNRAFYTEVFSKQDGLYQTLGDVFKTTKNNSVNGVLNRNFSLLGDPSMKLSYPDLTVNLNTINDQPIAGGDTMGAMQKVKLAGDIRDKNLTIAADFNGILEVTVMDRERLKTTLGNSGAPFAYLERDNILFRGPVSIKNGVFEINFIVPKNISYDVGNAKVSLYAFNKENNLDAGGADLRISIGGTNNSVIEDTTPPKIIPYLNDTTFQSGDAVRPNTLLLAALSDENGINISKDQVGQSLKAILDDSVTLDLTDYYSANIDDFSNGLIQYPLNGLAPGYHQITIYAWDTHNNGTSSTIEFYVDGDLPIVIREFNNYPNPMKNSTSLYISHDNEGDDIILTFEVISRTGQVVFSETRSYQSAPGVINDWEWDGRNYSGGKMNEGLYIIAISLRSTSGDSVFKRYSRLIMTN